MASGGFVEEMMREQSLLQATCGDLFDHIDDLLDFSKEESAADVLLLDAPPPPGSPLSARIIDVGGAARTAPPARDDGNAASFFDAAGGAHAFGGGHVGSCDDDLDMAQLEWLSGLFDDTSIPHEPAFPATCAAPIKTSALAAANAGVPMMLPPDNKLDDDDAIFRSSSPISVLEEHNNTTFNANNNNVGSSTASSSYSSSSSSSSAWSAPLSRRPDPPPVLVIPARARSKRSRPSAFTGGRGAVEPPTILVPTPMYSATAASHSDPESIAESDDPNAAAAPPKNKKKKAKKPAPVPTVSDAEGDADVDADYVEGGEPSSQPQGTVRRCTHCQIEKTPQWRAGPLGPKTLCNACGVRYKSGRLFPEYRPAASPTFVPAIHSNSHKKVVEMRQKTVRTADPSCDLLQLIRRRD